MIYGIDYLGAAGNWRGNYIRAMCANHPKDFAAGFLCKASGWRNGMRAARKLAATGKCKVMRIHGIWRDDHAFTRRDIRKAVKQARKVAKLACKYPEIQFYFSPWLEHRAPLELWKDCRAACKKVLPKSVKIVSSGTQTGGIDEVHHALPVPGKYLFSFDGADMLQENVAQWKRLHPNALIFFGWIPSCNGKASLHDQTPRRLRQQWPTAMEIRQITAALMI